MTLDLFALVLFASFLHAAWNVAVKSGGNKLFETGLTALGALAPAIIPVFYLPPILPAAYPFIFVSCFCHFGYYLFMAKAYQQSDLSLSYPLMRGSAPLITTLALFFLAKSPTLQSLAGIILLSTGIISLAFEQLIISKSSLRPALITALWISGYTVLDGLGANQSGSGVSYACWLFVGQAIPISIYLLTKFGRTYLTYAKANFKRGFLGGVASFFAYAIALYAMTQCSIASVAALRESSVIFGLLLAVIFLHEKLTKRRIIAVLLVALGAAILKMA